MCLYELVKRQCFFVGSSLYGTWTPADFNKSQFQQWPVSHLGKKSRCFAKKTNALGCSVWRDKWRFRGRDLPAGSPTSVLLFLVSLTMVRHGMWTICTLSWWTLMVSALTPYRAAFQIWDYSVFVATPSFQNTFRFTLAHVIPILHCDYMLWYIHSVYVQVLLCLPLIHLLLLCIISGNCYSHPVGVVVIMVVTLHPEVQRAWHVSHFG